MPRLMQPMDGHKPVKMQSGRTLKTKSIRQRACHPQGVNNVKPLYKRRTNSKKGLNKMNKVRRKEIQRIIEKVEALSGDFEELLEEIESVKNDEKEYRDNMPENLQSSERYETAESACEALENAYDTLDEAKDQLDEVVSSLEEAMN